MSLSPDPASLPCSPLDETGGLKYFRRMVGKIRLHATGTLWEELLENLGKGSDARCCDFLRVDYADLKTQVLTGLSDAELLTWCQAHGRSLTETDYLVWNAFISKLGWNDAMTPTLERRKKEANLTDRDDILTIAHFIDVDEGRCP